MSAISGYNTALTLTSPTNIALTNEAMTDSGDHTTFTVTNAAHVFFNPGVAFVVQTAPDGSTWTTAASTTYTINYPVGKVVFNSAVTGGTPSCRISSGGYFAGSLLGYANSCDISLVNSFVDTTSFSTTGTPIRAKSWTPTLQEATFKLHKWWIDNTFFTDLQAGSLIAISAALGQTGTQKMTAYMYIKQDDVKTMVAGVTEESLDLQTTGQFFYIG